MNLDKDSFLERLRFLTFLLSFTCLKNKSFENQCSFTFILYAQNKSNKTFVRRERKQTNVVVAAPTNEVQRS
jgi:hypothetical protein